MKKILIMFIVLFLLTGCDVTYNLDIDGKDYKETTSILESFDTASLTGELNSNYKLYDIYYAKPIPLSTLAPIQSENNNVVEGVEYYKKTNLSTDENFGFQTYGVFNKKNSIVDSNIVSFGCGNVNIDEDNEKIVINTDKIKAFNQFSSLNNVTVNIKSKYKSSDNNADKVKGKVYTWNINRDNYENKTIYIVLDKNEVNLGKDNIMTIFTIGIVLLVIIVSVIVYILKVNFDKKNSL